jgi:hypothetical protein
MPRLLVPPGTTYVQTPHQAFPIENGQINVPDGHPDLATLLTLGFSVPAPAEPVTPTAQGPRPRKGETHA